MGREIELKIPLSEEQYKNLFDFVTGVKKIDGEDIEISGLDRIKKSDEYFSRYGSRAERNEKGEPQVIRIRSSSNGNIGEILPELDKGKIKPLPVSQSFFCIKRKVVENGIELNREDETFVENADVIRDILLMSGYHKYFEKKKDVLSVFCRRGALSKIVFHVELEIVNGLKYLEVEVTDEGVAADEVRAELEKFIEVLGLDVANKDSRNWIEIVNGDVL